MVYKSYISSREDKLRIALCVVLASIVFVFLGFFWQLQIEERLKLQEPVVERIKPPIQVEIEISDEIEEIFELEEPIIETDEEISEYVLDTTVYEEVEDEPIDDKPPTQEQEASVLPEALSGFSTYEQGESLYGSINPTPPRAGRSTISGRVQRPEVKFRPLDREVLPVYIALLKHNFTNYQLHQDTLDAEYKVWLRENNLIQHSGTVPILPLFSIELTFQEDLDNGIISEPLRQEFESNGVSLSPSATISIQKQGSRWLITGQNTKHTVRKGKTELIISSSKFSYTTVLFITGDDVEYANREMALRQGWDVAWKTKSFSTEERLELARYVRDGGFIFFNYGEGYGDKRDFRKTMRTELTNIFGSQWSTILSEHEIYNIKYSITDYELQGIKVNGRLAVIFSEIDLLSQKQWQFVTNVLLYATRYGRAIDIERYK